MNSEMKQYVQKGPEESQVSQVALAVKNLLLVQDMLRDTGSIPGSGRSPGDGHGDPFQCSCLEKPMVGYSSWGLKNQT